MTDVADPYRRDDDDVSIVPDVDDVTELDETDRDGTGRGDGVPREEDPDIYTRTAKAPGLESEDDADSYTRTAKAPGLESEDDADFYTRTAKAPGLETDEGTSLGDETTPVTPPVRDRADDPLEHGLGAGGGTAYDATVEPGTEFGLGSENTQDTPPVPEPLEPDPLRHGLGQADAENVK